MSLFENRNHVADLKYNIPASIVVFLVALPLCLAIALASGAPLFSGLISGIVGGIVVGFFSDSALGVSGPAAGLAAIVASSIEGLGGIAHYDLFLVAVVLAGLMQLAMGYARAGIIGYYFPSSVIHGMLSGIGIIIAIKQITHAFGYTGETPEAIDFINFSGENPFSEVTHMMDNISLGATIVTFVSLFILILWEQSFVKNNSILKLIPGPLLVVILGVMLNIYFDNGDFDIDEAHLVTIPVPESAEAFMDNFTLPNIAGIMNDEVWVTALLIAVVASLETLLSLEATDKLDPQKRVSSANQELKAQGIGNVVAGMIGGIPVTQVIVRSSANVQSGAKTKISAIVHGFWLLLSIILIPEILNMIPKATLAAILLIIGYKLAKPALFKKMYSQGMGQFLPYFITVAVMVVTFNLLWGIACGLIIAIFIILKNNLKVSYYLDKEDKDGSQSYTITLSEDVTFLNKASILKALEEIPNGSTVVIDASQNHFIHYDVLEIIENFEINAKVKDIDLTIIDLGKEVEHKPMKHFKITNK